MLLGMTGSGGHRSNALQRAGWSLSHLAGGVGGGFVLGAASWLAGVPAREVAPEWVLGFLVVSIGAVSVMIDLDVLAVDRSNRQVDARLRGSIGTAASYAVYGVEFGLGWRTLRPSAMFYTLSAVLAFAVSAPAVAVVAGIAFGLGRTFILFPGSYVATRLSGMLTRDTRSRAWWRLAGAFGSVAIVVSGIGDLV